MKRISADWLADNLGYAELAQAIGELFMEGCVVPARAHHSLAALGRADATLLLMPAWRSGGFIGVKIAAVFPSNADIGLPSVAAEYLLMDGATGTPLAMIDGSELTARRTAATSACAAARMARADSAVLLIVGTGRLSRHLARAHLALKPQLRVEVWGRSAERAGAVAADLASEGLDARAASDLQAACRGADIISCATLSTEPLVLGRWLAPGAHLDLVGGFTPAMREIDDEAAAGARIVCDTREAIEGSGDLVSPISAGLVSAEAIEPLERVLRSAAPDRRSAEERTLFKSVGSALEDLAAATLAYELFERSPEGGGPTQRPPARSL